MECTVDPVCMIRNYNQYVQCDSPAGGFVARIYRFLEGLLALSDDLALDEAAGPLDDGLPSDEDAAALDPSLDDADADPAPELPELPLLEAAAVAAGVAVVVVVVVVVALVTLSTRRKK